MVTKITQSEDIKVLDLEDLIGSFRVHVVKLQVDKPIRKVLSYLSCVAQLMNRMAMF